MTAETLSIASVLVAVAAALASWAAVWNSARQLKHQRDVQVAAQQPYIWVDIRPRSDDGQVLQFVVGNSGPTVATNVRVTLDADVPHAPRHDEFLREALDRFNRGHASMPPGRVNAWNLGTGVELLEESDVDRRMTVTIEGDGPSGPLTPLSYPIDLNDWRGMGRHADGSLYRVEKTLASQGDALVRAIGKLGRR